MCVLPQILLFGDTLIRKTSFTIEPNLRPITRGGAMRIDGRVRGTLNGFIDAEVHGFFTGDLSALVESNTISSLPREQQLPEDSQQNTSTGNEVIHP